MNAVKAMKMMNQNLLMQNIKSGKCLFFVFFKLVIFQFSSQIQC